MIQHLTIFDILTIHDQCIRRYGGLKRMPVEDAVSALIERARNLFVDIGYAIVFAFKSTRCVACSMRMNKNPEIQHLGVLSFMPREVE